MRGAILKTISVAAILAALFAAVVPARAQARGSAADDEGNVAELAKKLQNPVASLISVPIQNNWDFGIGSAKAMRYTANIQPVVPLSISSRNTNHDIARQERLGVAMARQTPEVAESHPKLAAPAFVDRFRMPGRS